LIIENHNIPFNIVCNELQNAKKQKNEKRRRQNLNNLLFQFLKIGEVLGKDGGENIFEL
jgi:hypothetical protein